MKDLKQGKIISINSSKKESKEAVDHQEQQTVEQMYCELQEISQKIDQHLKQNKVSSPLNQLPTTSQQNDWLKTLLQIKKKIVQLLFSRTKRFRRGNRFQFFKKYITNFKKKNQD